MSAKPVPVLSLDGVTKHFGSKAAVSNVSFEVSKGEVFGFLGPNGAGKTTTIRVILDVLRPDKGWIKIFGDTNRSVVSTHKRIGYLSGDMVLDGDLTGKQYLQFVDHQYGGKYKKRAQELAEQLDVDLNTKIESYSRGNKQKIALIAAMMHSPQLLILDEPTNGFDPLVQETFMRLIRKYQTDGGSVFMSSHILSEVQRLCSKVAFIKDGSIIGIKSIEELNKNSAKTIKITAKNTVVTTIKAGYKKVPNLDLNKSQKTNLEFNYTGRMKPLIKFLGNYDIEDLNIIEPELEDIFIEYYKD